MQRGEGVIDWSTASVTVDPQRESNTLSVRVAGEPGSHWIASFQGSAELLNQGQARRQDPSWGNITVTGNGSRMGETLIEVEGVQNGAEDKLKQQLDFTAKQATERAIPKVDEDERRLAERQAKANARAGQAADMEERFRAG
jgi:hypothetical protein